MLPIKPAHSFEQLKVLADGHHLAILRLLMASPASLTQRGASLNQHPAWVRHHLKALEKAGLVELVETRVESGVMEKYYQACASGFLLQELILPMDSDRAVVVFSRSHDLGIELLARQFARHLNVLFLTVGSLDGLISLRQSLCHFSGATLMDPSGEDNAPFVRHIFPERSTSLVTFAYREQGLILVAGNPRQVRDLSDLIRPEILFIKCQKGSGTRVWLDAELQRPGLPVDQIHGSDREVRLHTGREDFVRRGAADAAIGLRAAAAQAGLDFIPLFHERYDLVIPRAQESPLGSLLDALQNGGFRRREGALRGYDTTHMGETIPL
jgi:putative molybdopterin biosynthesis protein